MYTEIQVWSVFTWLASTCPIRGKQDERVQRDFPAVHDTRQQVLHASCEAAPLDGSGEVDEGVTLPGHEVHQYDDAEHASTP